MTLSHPRITRVETTAVRIVGPCLIVRLRAGETYGLGECYPSALAGVDSVATAMVFPR
jgi:hypothetical protein